MGEDKKKLSGKKKQKKINSILVLVIDLLEEQGITETEVRAAYEELVKKVKDKVINLNLLRGLEEEINRGEWDNQDTKNTLEALLKILDSRNARAVTEKNLNFIKDEIIQDDPKPELLIYYEGFVNSFVEETNKEKHGIKINNLRKLKEIMELKSNRDNNKGDNRDNNKGDNRDNNKGDNRDNNKGGSNKIKI